MAWGSTPGAEEGTNRVPYELKAHATLVIVTIKNRWLVGLLERKKKILIVRLPSLGPSRPLTSISTYKNLPRGEGGSLTYYTSDGWLTNFHAFPTNFVSRSVTRKVEPPKTNSDHKTNTMYHMHTLGASKFLHVIHNVGFGWFYLNWNPRAQTYH